MTSTLFPACNVSIKTLASLLNKKTIGILMSSVPSPDIENKGLLAAVVPLLLSTTIPPLAPAFSKIRAFSEKNEEATLKILRKIQKQDSCNLPMNIHSPRSTMTIFPQKSLALSGISQDVKGSANTN